MVGGSWLAAGTGGGAVGDARSCTGENGGNGSGQWFVDSGQNGKRTAENGCGGWARRQKYCRKNELRSLFAPLSWEAFICVVFDYIIH